MITLEPLTRRREKVRVHIVNIKSRKFAIIVGTDVMQEVGCTLMDMERHWR